MSTCRSLFLTLTALLSGTAVAQLAGTFTEEGIQSLTHNGVEMIHPRTAFSEIPIPQAEVVLETRGMDGKGLRTYTFKSTEDEKPAATSFDPATNTYLRSYSWGTARISYNVREKRMGISAVLTNTTEQTIANFTLILLYFRHRDGWKDVGNGSMMDRFGYTGFSDDAIKVLAACKSFDVPLKMGMAICGGTCGRMLSVSGGMAVPDTAERTIHPHGMPRIAPGDSLQLEFSVRFDDPSTDNLDMLADLIEPYRQSLEPLHVWPDRRPIGMIFHSSGYSGHTSETNPRGYFNDPKVDIISDSGRQKFYERMLKAADREIANLKKMGSQGMILWDIEGQENPHPITYIGDPRMTKVFAPEMDTIADAYFKKYADAGLRTGVCLRPTRVYFNEKDDKWKHNTGSDGGHVDGITPHAVYQDLKPDDLPWWDFFPTVERMSDKIQYCIDRWGCSLFYFDTPGEWRRVGAERKFTYVQLHTYVYRELARRFPGAFIVPEFVRQSDLAYVGNYTELDLGGKGTSATNRRLLPDAIEVINVSDGDFAANRDRLYRAIEEGDIIMHHGWWWPKRNQETLELYQEAIDDGVELMRGDTHTDRRQAPPAKRVPRTSAPSLRLILRNGAIPCSPGCGAGVVKIFGLNGRLIHKVRISEQTRSVRLPGETPNGVSAVRIERRRSAWK